MKLFFALLFAQSVFGQIHTKPAIKNQGEENRKQVIHSLVDSIEVCFTSSDFELMTRYVDSVKTIIKPQDPNYYKIKSYEATLLMHAKSFNEAIDISRIFLRSSGLIDPSDLIRFEFVLSNSLSYRDSYQNKEAKKYVLKIEKRLLKEKGEEMNLIRITNLFSLCNIYYYEAKYDSVIYYVDGLEQY